MDIDLNIHNVCDVVIKEEKFDVYKNIIVCTSLSIKDNKGCTHNINLFSEKKLGIYNIKKKDNKAGK